MRAMDLYAKGAEELTNTTISITRIELILMPVSYTHLRAHETVLDLVCRLLLEKKKAVVSDKSHR